MSDSHAEELITAYGCKSRDYKEGFSDGRNITLVNSFRNNFDANQDIFLCLKAI